MKHPGLIVSCEHGGHGVPRAYTTLFAGHETTLATHRGWDPGALPLARQLAGALDAPLYASTTTRLLVDLNRSLGHRQLFSEFTRGLAPAERQQIIERHYRPHRDTVEAEVARRVAGLEPVVHIASHSFTPVLGGVVRRADVAWLYDPRRCGEVSLSTQWMAAFAQRAPGLQLRRNDPYRGRGDGLTSLLRKRYADAAYVGIELEVNQRFVAQGGAAWVALRLALVESLASVLGHPAPV